MNLGAGGAHLDIERELVAHETLPGGWTMRTTPGGYVAPSHDVEAEASPIVVDLRPGPRRRVGTLAFFGAIGIVAWIVATSSGEDASDRALGAATSSPSPGSSALEPGTYRLPGLSAAVSLTLPEGWAAGDSSWGPAGQGVAVVSTGLPGASISLAVFDLDQLRPFEAESNQPRSRPGDRAWYARSLDDYHARVEARVRDRSLERSSTGALRRYWRGCSPTPIEGRSR